MYYFAIIILIIYTLALLLILFYSFAQLNLLFNYLKSERKKKKQPPFDISDPAKVPFVTIQLPVFNEMYVVERLLDNISKIEYPPQKLEIQVLDDSTDESVQITANKITILQKTGLNIQHIRRNNRSGFKAGALKEGLKTARGEFIAIFDADFLPQKDWLLQTLPYFENDKIGVVQTRWGHVNRNYSLLTKMQAFAIDVHFTIEQMGRNHKNHFINFNGTAGIWRKKTIIDAGNWQGDTLTEDLDLSYRAQLKGWKFKYLVDVETPAEIPAVISAARSQQFRWNKGGAENFKKYSWKVLQASNIPLKTKIHGIIHLLNSTLFINVLIVAVLSVPVLYIKNSFPKLSNYFAVTGLFIVSTLIFFFSYWFSYKKIMGGGIKNYLSYVKLFISFLAIAMGFSVHNTVAAVQGHIGKKSEFIRTPKFNIRNIHDSWKSNRYLSKKLSLNIVIEGFLIFYFLFAILSALKLNDFGFIPFYFLIFSGFVFVFYKSISNNV
ncbi:cellulose synthase family protein [Abyssalbus ytuae]|uniref:Glycosyltransferase n=1 Tax=Abyssalbus ytuae TaxID=2926907 RepID=A0A9E6ZQL3_9FLAO|nr:glycosyltransferase [Abyssalbus ytuae]UOB18765.1 glycosyltransferase [Abyssalbus ytuae]